MKKNIHRSNWQVINVVSKHKLEYNHDFNWHNLQILHKENNYFKRRLAEMFYIKKEGNNCLNVITDLKNYKLVYNVILNQLLFSKFF